MADSKHYNIKLTTASKKDINKLPKVVKVNLIEKHFPKLRTSPVSYAKRLHGCLKGYYSYHFGHHPEYRILFIIISNEIIISMIASRENFYNEAYRRLI